MSTEQQQEAGKEKKKFEANLKKLVAILGGGGILKKRGRLPKDDFASAMAEVVGEEKAEKLALVKTKTKELIKAKIAYDEFLIGKQREFDKEVEGKLKEFNGMADSIFSMVEGIELLEKTYYDTLTSVSTTGTPASSDAQ